MIRTVTLTEIRTSPTFLEKAALAGTSALLSRSVVGSCEEYAPIITLSLIRLPIVSQLRLVQVFYFGKLLLSLDNSRLLMDSSPPPPQFSVNNTASAYSQEMLEENSK